jgi:hypothetical protein
MSAGWSAACVRARALLRRRLGAGGARELAASTSLTEALHTLVASPYGHAVRIGQSLAEAERAVSAVLLWHLRVLAGWQPQAGAELVRVLAGWFEVANVVDRLRAGDQPPFRLGALAVAGSRAEAAVTREELRQALAASAWGDPGSADPSAIVMSLQAAWAARVAFRVPQARAWACGGAALLVARERYSRRCRLPGAAARRVGVLFGGAGMEAASLEEFARRLPGQARWALEGVHEPSRLWQAEARWWWRVEQDAVAFLRRPGFGPDPVVGCVALLAADARRVQAALGSAARGGRPLEVFDVVA